MDEQLKRSTYGLVQLSDFKVVWLRLRRRCDRAEADACISQETREKIEERARLEALGAKDVK